jgi:uncharacterized metal-binding protein
MLCPGGFGGDVSLFVLSAKDALVMVTIDGCPVGCAKAVLKQARVPLKYYLVVTGEGIEKSGNLNLSRADIDRVKAAVKRVVRGQASSGVRPFAGSCGCASCSTDKSGS